MIGVVTMLAMFQGASIPMMEERSLARRPDYQRVIDTVPQVRAAAAVAPVGHVGHVTRVVVAGMGDTGVLSAIELRRRLPDAEIVGITTKPGLVSGQELGLRLARPDRWSRDYRIPFARFRGLDGVRIVHESVSSVDLGGKQVAVGDQVLDFDVLVVATGVRNGFWRQPDVLTTTRWTSSWPQPTTSCATPDR